jgi:hypothetical protein
MDNSIMKAFKILCVVGLLILSLVLFRTSTTTAVVLHSGWINVLGADSALHRLWSQFSTPSAGEHVLPPPVQAGIMLLRSNHVSSFRYSPAIGKDEEIRQRLIEGAYPLRNDDQARFCLSYESEPVAPTCVILARTGGMVLADCP